MKLSIDQYCFLLTALIAVSSIQCSDKDSPDNLPDPLKIEVDLNSELQTIAGFGGANRMWGTQFLKPAEAQKAFGVGENELGLSIFRVRIASDESEWPLILESVKEARKFGVKIIASPWSPPTELKSNASDIGGYLLPENYEAFKDHINAFIEFMNANGVDIHSVSVQNEPDIQVSYESCDWSSTTMGNFIRDFGDQIVGAKLAAPESFNFNYGFTNELLFKDEVAVNFDIVAGHIYGGGLSDFLQAEDKGKEIWMTEYLLNLNYGAAGDWSSASDALKWEETLEMLETVHASMTHNWNAYIWWYLQRFYSFIGDGEEGTVAGEVLKRGYAFSHYSRFVRPGYLRKKVSLNKSNDLLITAYSGDNKLVYVIVNPSDKPVSDCRMSVDTGTTAISYTTTLNVTLDMTQHVADIGGEINIEIPPRSVLTVIAQ